MIFPIVSLPPPEKPAALVQPVQAPQTAPPANQPDAGQQAWLMAPQPPASLRVFFYTDVQSHADMMKRFITLANQQQPDLLLDGGDTVHDGTEAEFRRAESQRRQLLAPVYRVTGNHDAELRGSFKEPLPALPDFQSFDCKQVHFILLGNQDGFLDEGQFRRLEADLAAHAGQTTIVAMHVPPFLSKERLASRLTRQLPLKLKSPVMSDPQQVQRFSDLMSRYHVALVLAGHTHAGDEMVKGGVKYVIAGATGGLTPGLGIQREYLDIVVQGQELQVRRIPLDQGIRNPVAFVGQALDFYRDLNGFNHQQMGWSYVPSVSLQYHSGTRLIHTRLGHFTAGILGTSLERMLDPQGKSALTAFGSLAVGSQEISTHLGLGYKYRLLGDFNRGLYLGGGVGANGGLSGGFFSAGVGSRLTLGLEYNSLTLELGQEWATNFSAQVVSLGYRF